MSYTGASPNGWIACAISHMSRKQTINTVPTLDFLRDLVSTIPDPIEAQPKTPSSRPRRSTLEGDQPAPRNRRTKKVKTEGGSNGNGDVETEAAEPVEPVRLPDVGTWKKEMDGDGGTGEGGKGLYDDYEVEEDEDDY